MESKHGPALLAKRIEDSLGSLDAGRPWTCWGWVGFFLGSRGPNLGGTCRKSLMFIFLWA